MILQKLFIYVEKSNISLILQKLLIYVEKSNDSLNNAFCIVTTNQRLMHFMFAGPLLWLIVMQRRKLMAILSNMSRPVQSFQMHHISLSLSLSLSLTLSTQLYRYIYIMLVCTKSPHKTWERDDFQSRGTISLSLSLSLSLSVSALWRNEKLWSWPHKLVFSYSFLESHTLWEVSAVLLFYCTFHIVLGKIFTLLLYLWNLYSSTSIAWKKS